MLTQTGLNNLIHRVDILLNTHNYNSAHSLVMLDVKEFFHKLKNIEKIINIPKPLEVEFDRTTNELFMEWYQITEYKKFDYLKIGFLGDQKIKLTADYGSLEIDIKQNVPFSEDFAELILAHLKQFRSPIKKKRYK